MMKLFFFQHLTKCPGSNQQSTPVVTTPVPVPAPHVETRKTKECARCGKVLLIIGGVYARHIAKCQVLINSLEDTSASGKAFSCIFMEKSKQIGIAKIGTIAFLREKK